MKKLLSILTCLAMFMSMTANTQAKRKDTYLYFICTGTKWAKVKGNKWSLSAKTVTYPKLMSTNDAKKGKETIYNDYFKWTDKYYPKMKQHTYSFYVSPSTKYYTVMNVNSGNVRVEKISKSDMAGEFKTLNKHLTESMCFQINGNKIKNVYLSYEA